MLKSIEKLSQKRKNVGKVVPIRTKCLYNHPFLYIFAIKYFEN